MSEPVVERSRAHRARGPLLGLLLAMGCENVTTAPAEDQSMLAAPGGEAARPPAKAEPTQEASAAPSEPQKADLVLEPQGASTPPPERESKGLEIDSAELEALGCRRWLDDADSDLRFTDLEVWFIADGTEGPGSKVAETPRELCSAATPPPPGETSAGSGDGGAALDAGAPEGDAGALARDAGLPDAALEAGRPDAAAADGPFHAVDLGVEGWALVNGPDGLWLEFCPNACYTLTRVQRGTLAVTVWYEVVPGAAAR